MPLFRTRPPVPKQQPDAVLDQDNPVSGTKYTVLDTQRDVRIRSVNVRCAWTVEPASLKIHITIDGITETYVTAPPGDGSNYGLEVMPDAVPTGQRLSTTYYAKYCPFVKEGRNIKVEAEVIGGTVSNLFSRVKWAKF